MVYKLGGRLQAGQTVHKLGDYHQNIFLLLPPPLLYLSYTPSSLPSFSLLLSLLPSLPPPPCPPSLASLVQQYSEHVWHSPEVRFALDTALAMSSNNFVKFFKLVQ